MSFPDPSALLVLAALHQCPAAPPPAIEMKFINKSPTYDSRLTAAQLGNFNIDTKFSHRRDEVFTTGGVTEGTIGTGIETIFKKLSDPRELQACIWLEKIEITVSYTPLVHIASELSPGTCRYNTTLQHENRHVATDVITVKEYIPHIKYSVEEAAGTIGVISLPAREIDRKKQQVMAVLGRSLKATVDSMEKVRFQRQQLIDTRQEYLRLSNACPP